MRDGLFCRELDFRHKVVEYRWPLLYVKNLNKLGTLEKHSPRVGHVVVIKHISIVRTVGTWDLTDDCRTFCLRDQESLWISIHCVIFKILYVSGIILMLGRNTSRCAGASSIPLYTCWKNSNFDSASCLKSQKCSEVGMGIGKKRIQVPIICFQWIIGSVSDLCLVQHLLMNIPFIWTENTHTCTSQVFEKWLKCAGIWSAVEFGDRFDILKADCRKFLMWNPSQNIKYSQGHHFSKFCIVKFQFQPFPLISLFPIKTTASDFGIVFKNFCDGKHTNLK